MHGNAVVTVMAGQQEGCCLRWRQALKWGEGVLLPCVDPSGQLPVPGFAQQLSAVGASCHSCLAGASVTAFLKVFFAGGQAQIIPFCRTPSCGLPCPSSFAWVVRSS